MKDTVFVAAILLGLYAFALWVHVHLALERKIHREHLNIARFPMFAARDELVLLVARGEIEANDPAWTAIYGAVTDLLRRHEKVNLLEYWKENLEYAAALEADPDFRKEVAETDAAVSRRMAEVPAFATAYEHVKEAFVMILAAGTTWRHRLRLELLASKVRSQLSRDPGHPQPKPSELRYWSGECQAA